MSACVLQDAVRVQPIPGDPEGENASQQGQQNVAYKIADCMRTNRDIDMKRDANMTPQTLRNRSVAARGFTLIELLATLSVLVILTSLAAASMSSTVNNNRIYATQTEFLASLALARSEAARRGVPVVLSATAPVTGNAFAGGWRVWVDLDGNGSFDSATEPVLRTHESIPSSILVGDGTTTDIGFTPVGFLSQGGAVDIKVCASDGAVAGYDISIQPNGMADVADVAAHTTPCN
jgi:type IV fimbrial biogenesis protein FimT